MMSFRILFSAWPTEGLPRMSQRRHHDSLAEKKNVRTHVKIAIRVWRAIVKHERSTFVVFSLYEDTKHKMAAP